MVGRTAITGSAYDAGGASGLSGIAAVEPLPAGAPVADTSPASEARPATEAPSGTPSPFARDVIWTMATTALIGVAVIVLNADLARRGATDVFAPVNYAKRAAGIVVPLLSLCTTVGVVRFVAGARSELERRLARCGTIWLVLAIVAAGTAIVALFGPAISSASALEPVALLWATWAYSVSMVLNGISYGLRRGEMRQGAANWVNLWANALVPVLVVVFAPRGWTAATLLLWISVPVAAAHAVELSVISVRNALQVDTWSGLVGATRRLAVYSAARVPGAVASSAMSAIGPVMVARGWVSGPNGLSGLLAALAVVSVAYYSLQAVGMVVLPRASALASAGSDGLRLMASRLLVAAVVLSSVAVPFGLILARDVCVAWFGEEFAGAAPLVQLVLLSVPAVLAQVLLRSLIDGAIERAWNTYAMLAGLIVCVLGSLVARDGAGLAAAYTAGTWVTGVWMVAVVRVRFGAGVSAKVWLVSLSFACISALTAWAALAFLPASIARLAVSACVAVPLAVIPFIKSAPLYRTLWTA